MKLVFTDKDLSRGKYLPPEGTFYMKIVEVKPGTSKAGNQMYSIKFRCLIDYLGQEYSERVPILPQTQFRWVNLFSAAGFSNEELKQGLNPEQLLGKYLGVKRISLGQAVNPRTGKHYEESKETYFRLTEAQLARVREADPNPGSETFDPGFDSDSIL